MCLVKYTVCVWEYYTDPRHFTVEKQACICNVKPRFSGTLK
jgi:hypothetical protein